jgi:hypothetical protein
LWSDTPKDDLEAAFDYIFIHKDDFKVGFFCEIELKGRFEFRFCGLRTQNTAFRVASRYIFFLKFGVGVVFGHHFVSNTGDGVIPDVLLLLCLHQSIARYLFGVDDSVLQRQRKIAKEHPGHRDSLFLGWGLDGKGQRRDIVHLAAV